MNDWRIDLAAIAVLFACLFFIGGPLASSDSFALYYVAKRQHVQFLLEHHSLLLWNESLFSGFYQLGNPILGLLSPFILLYFLIPNFLAMDFHYFLLFCISYFSVRSLLSQFEFSLWQSRLGAFCYLFSGVYLSNIKNFPYFTEVSLAPLLFLFWLHFSREKTLRSSVLLGLIAALVIAEGGLQFFLVYATFAGVLLLWEGFSKERLLLLAHFSVAIFIAVGLNIITFWGAMESLGDSRRGVTSGIEMQLIYSLHPLRWLSVLLPSIWGYYPDGTFTGEFLRSPKNPFAAGFWLDSIFFSTPIFLGLALAAKKFFCRKTLPFYIFIAILILLAMGEHLPLFEWFATAIPFFGKFRFPEKYYSLVFPLLFFCGLLGLRSAARSFHTENGEEYPKIALSLRRIYQLVLVLLVIVLGMNLLDPSARIFGTFSNVKFLHLGFVITMLGLLNFRVSLGTLSKLRMRALKDPLLFALAVASVELVLLSPPQLRKSFADFREYSPLQASIEKFEWPFRFRLLLDKNVQKYSGNLTWPERLHYNWGNLLGIDYLFGYNPIFPARLDKIQGAEVFQNFAIWSRILAVDGVLTTARPLELNLHRLVSDGALSLAAVDTAKNLAFLTALNFKPRFAVIEDFNFADGPESAFDAVTSRGNEEAPLWIERSGIREQNPSSSTATKDSDVVMPTDPARIRVHSAEYAANSRTFRVSTDKPSYLVLRQQFHPAWIARVNGSDSAVARADFFNPAVLLPVGDNQVEFKFRPLSFYWGRWVVLVILLISIAFLVMDKKKPALRAGLS